MLSVTLKNKFLSLYYRCNTFSYFSEDIIYNFSDIFFWFLHDLLLFWFTCFWLLSSMFVAAFNSLITLGSLFLLKHEAQRSWEEAPWRGQRFSRWVLMCGGWGRGPSLSSSKQFLQGQSLSPKKNFPILLPLLSEN